jgi:hypothetical protein
MFETVVLEQVLFLLVLGKAEAGLAVEVEIDLDLAGLEFFQLLQSVGLEGFGFTLGGLANLRQQVAALLFALGDPRVVLRQDRLGG